MDSKYFHEQIKDELCGSKAYIKRAIEIKAMNSDWAKMFVTMSKAEMDHATNLYKMFQDYYTKLRSSYKEMPEYIEDKKADIDELYAEKVECITALHAAYDKL